jgi:hypothetical protein
VIYCETREQLPAVRASEPIMPSNAINAKHEANYAIKRSDATTRKAKKSLELS